MTPTTLPAGFTESAVVMGLTAPTAMDFAPDGRLFVLEQAGKVKLVHDDGTTWTALSLNVDPIGERGLLGIAFDPGFTSNHYVYLYYTNKNAGASTWATGEHNQLSRFTVNDTNPLQPVFTNEAPILDWNTLLSTATNHNGGAIHFGLDGKLYADAGDNTQTFTQGGISYRVSQSPATLLGKQLRIDVAAFNNGSATRDDTTVGHLIPSDNPFVADASFTGINKLIYVLGLRNPFTFAVQPGTGTIYINDVGENTYEEIDQSIAGGNYGWSGGNTDGFLSQPPIGPGTYHDPLLAYTHTGGASAIVGGTFYDPITQQFPASYRGKYFFGDLSAGWIHVFDPAHPGSPTNQDTSASFATGTAGGLRDLKVDAAGNLYYLTGTGVVEKISYTAPLITTQPTDHSVFVGQSVTFTAAANGSPSPTVQWQLSTDGGGTFSTISGATATSYTIASASLAMNGEKFRAVFTNASGTAATSVATLNVSPASPASLVFAIGTNSLAYTRSLDASGNPTGDYTPLGSGPVNDLATTRYGNGPNVEAFVVGLDHQLYADKLDATNHSSGYFATAYGSIATVSAGTDKTGNPLVFAVGSDSQLYELKFDASGNLLGGGSYTKAAVGSFQSAELTYDSNHNPLLYALGQDNQVYGLKLDSTGTPSGTLFKVNPGAEKQLVVTHDASNTPEIFVVGMDGSISDQMLDGSGSPIGSYVAFDGGVSSISMTRVTGGTPEMFAVGTDGLVYGHKFDAAGNPSRGFFQVSPTFMTSALAAGLAANQDPVLYAIGTDSQIYAAPFNASGDPTGPFALTAPLTVKKIEVV